MFVASAEAEHVLLRWGSGSGPILAAFPRRGEADSVADPDDLLARWDGVVRVGGFVERLHLLTFGDVELAVIEIVGGAQPVDHRSLASLDDMRASNFEFPALHEPIGAHLPYPFVLEAESSFFALAQDALVAGLAVDAAGRLAADDQALHDVCGLPLLMTGLTIHR